MKKTTIKKSDLGTMNLKQFKTRRKQEAAHSAALKQPDLFFEAFEDSVITKRPLPLVKLTVVKGDR